MLFHSLIQPSDLHISPQYAIHWLGKEKTLHRFRILVTGLVELEHHSSSIYFTSNEWPKNACTCYQSTDVHVYFSVVDFLSLPNLNALAFGHIGLCSGQGKISLHFVIVSWWTNENTVPRQIFNVPYVPGKDGGRPWLGYSSLPKNSAVWGSKWRWGHQTVPAVCSSQSKRMQSHWSFLLLLET